MEARTEYLDEKDKAEARQTMINRLLASLGGLGSMNSEPTSGGGSYEEINTAKYNSVGPSSRIRASSMSVYLVENRNGLLAAYAPD